MPPDGLSAPVGASRRLVGLGALGVLVAAADTYVVVLALPDVMAAVGLDVDELQRAAPVVSVFLLGYICVLPLIGRLSDVVGRRRVLLACLLVFAVGSLVTAAADDLASVLTGRFLQGVGGGGLVPVTLALVADLWPLDRRGTPLGLVGAAQELGALLGPLVGAVVIAVADWRAIFWLNLVVGLVLAVACAGRPQWGGVGGARDPLGAALLAGVVGLSLLGYLRPRALAESVAFGRTLEPVAGGSAWFTPVAIGALTLAGAFVVRELTASAPLVDLRAAGRALAAVDLLGGLLLAVALGGVVASFAVADPAVELVADAAPWLLALSALAATAFGVRQRRAADPLLPRGTLGRTAGWGSLVVSALVGAALIAVLVDVPVFVRTTVSGSDQLDAALVLVRFLVAVPVGALVGGQLLRRVPAALVTAVALLGVTAALVAMARWDVTALVGAGAEGTEQGVGVALGATGALVVAGFGFGLAIAPVNAALLAATPASAHGVASALLVVARMTGMLVGLSVLTAVGLRRFAAAQSDVPNPLAVCPENPLQCPAYTDALREAAVSQTQTIFAGGAVCAGVAAVAALVLLRPRQDAATA